MFYGSDVYANGTLRKSKSDEPVFSLNETMWKRLNEINVEQFLHDTRPSFSLHLCDIQGHKCITRWRRRRNFWGHCLEFSSAWFFGKHPQMSTNIRLSFTFSWAEEDFTNGDILSFFLFFKQNKNNF